MNYYLKESSEIFLLKYLKCTKITIFIIISPKSGKKALQGQQKHKKAHKRAAAQKKAQKSTCAFLKHCVRALYYCQWCQLKLTAICSIWHQVVSMDYMVSSDRTHGDLGPFVTGPVRKGNTVKILMILLVSFDCVVSSNRSHQGPFHWNRHCHCA